MHQLARRARLRREPHQRGWHDAGTRRARGQAQHQFGDERSAVRKLREALYAAEMDRVLGKARVLQLYLTVAPWGGGQCGGQAAALQLLHKRASALTPIEAAWLASLLRNPEAELARVVANGSVDKARVADIIEAMRPLARARREALQEQLADWPMPATSAFAAR